jgi:hypothetical protein
MVSVGSGKGPSVCDIAGVVVLSVGLTLSVGKRVAKGLDGLDGRTFEGFEVTIFVGFAFLEGFIIPNGIGSKATSLFTGATVGDGEMLGVVEGAHSSGIRMHASGLRAVSC